jgi:hypothetical protein
VPKVEIEKADILVFAPSASDAQVQQLITGTISRAALFAPCIRSDDFDEDKAAAAKDILIEVIRRALEYGTGAVSNIIAGPYQASVDTKQPRRRRFEADEIRELKRLCGIRTGGAYSVALAYDPDDAFSEYVTPNDA